MLMQNGNQNGYAGSAGGHSYESAGVTATDHTIRKIGNPINNGIK